MKHRKKAIDCSVVRSFARSVITLIHPTKLAEVASAEDVRSDGLNVSAYAETVVILRKKGFSYGEIAEWICEKTGAAVPKGRVYRVYQDWASKNPKESAAIENDAETSEAAAAAADGKPKRK